MRFATILCLLCVMVVVAPTAGARGADGKEVAQNLLERGYDLLRRAERNRSRGEAAQSARDAQEAERIFAAVMNQEPGNAQAALLGGQAATLAGDQRSAAQWVQRLVKIAPAGANDPEVLYLVAFVQLVGDKRPDRALRSLTRMYTLDARVRPLERDTLWFRALGEHGRNLMLAKQFNEAIVEFRLGARIARRLGNQRYEFLMIANIGAALVQDNRYIEATEIYAGLAKAEPRNPLWQFRLALCQANQSRFAEAIPIYREVIRLMDEGNPIPAWASDVAMVRLRLGNCLRHLAELQPDAAKTASMYAEAEVLIRSYIKQAPEDALGHKWLATLLFENLNKPYEALPLFERSFGLDPVCDDALRFMLQIRRSFPPPEGIPEEAWRAPIAALSKDLEEGAERRRETRRERYRQTGSEGCN